MNRFVLKAAGLALAFAATVAPSAWAGDCRNVSGRAVETVADPFGAPNDPFGRVLAVYDGTINAVGTAILTSIAPGAGGPPNWVATTRHVFVVNERDQLAAVGAANITPVAGSTTDVNDTVTLTINGTDASGTATSTGKYAGATGTIVLTGVGTNFYNPFPFPAPTAGATQFVFHYKGQICFP